MYLPVGRQGAGVPLGHHREVGGAGTGAGDIGRVESLHAEPSHQRSVLGAVGSGNQPASGPELLIVSPSSLAVVGETHHLDQPTTGLMRSSPGIW